MEINNDVKLVTRRQTHKLQLHLGAMEHFIVFHLTVLVLQSTKPIFTVLVHSHCFQDSFFK